MEQNIVSIINFDKFLENMLTFYANSFQRQFQDNKNKSLNQIWFYSIYLSKKYFEAQDCNQKLSMSKIWSDFITKSFK